ncbi:hypothetical protein FHS04_002819 [Mesoflavibacter sabulilitoris]|uniref:Secretion system C-terminal sorting domain-containing protein n=1 Tax=Mesoflavibacter zeaxanthinifaciens subsp. sabulilitoris TaxID=1520893 RepID=A0A2T1NNP9_9FLAO|nr:T9SS type A sorting domain-containing protein [Mesoflavibacter zeaxanthinifaciens]MBB3125275.1 hypothetical protein [Mesoflavibacter zeaxanthinifaciens subsp. sabulilitoris]PSG94511.1 hypothetical protein C7H61_00830 [Mesoflavibacter zeaxanthinifaciens subsp. sabulilitoris]
MRNINLIILIFISHLSISQVSVINSESIYVTNEVFYIEDNLELKNINSLMYLRNNAQLIQGPGTTGNSGIGQLSVYQEGTSNNYSYNYWCSPVGNVSVNTTDNNTFIPNQNIYDALDNLNSNLAGYSTNNYNGTSNPLNIEDYWLWKYNPGMNYNDWIYVGQNGTVETGYGFTMKGVIGATVSSGQLYDFRGKPNEGEITVAVEANKETLIGNPYPSALDAVALIHNVNNASLLDTGTLYYWEQDQNVTSHNLANYKGGYASYTIDASGSIETFVPATFNTYDTSGNLNSVGNVSNSGKIAKRYIPIGQGFIIKGLTNGSIIISDSFRTFYKESDIQSEFFRTNSIVESASTNNTSSIINYTPDGLSIVPSDCKRFRLNIDFNNTYTRQLVQNLKNSFTPGEDYGVESKINTILPSDIFWPQGINQLVTQANAFNLDLILPLELTLDNDELIRFRLIDVQNFDSTQPIYIHDILNDTYTDLRTTNFEINLVSGSYPDRFEITFQESSLSIDEFTADSINVYHNNSSSELILYNPKNKLIVSIELFDILGKKIFQDSINSNTENYSKNTDYLSKGVYLVRVNLSSNKTINKKIIIK